MMAWTASIVWAGLAVLSAVGFGVVTGIVHPDEKVNGLWLVVAAACIYVLAYRFYGGFLARRVVELDNRRITPAHRRPGRVGAVTVIGVVLLVAAVIAGRAVAQSSLAGWFDLERSTLVWLMAAYGFFASVLPVWMLLVPRDYLSSFMKVSVIALLGVGVIVMAPTIEMPRVTGFIAGGERLIPGPIFPFVFITIACGAISGFHSLVSSGTTPKMIDRESHALVGYGAMLMEGFVGVIALIAASLLAPGDYFAINTKLSAEALGALGYPVAHIQELSRIVEQDIMGRPGGAVSLAVGMASIFSALPGMTGLMAYWYQFALLFEALFILTTIDAGPRVARYLLHA